MKSIPPFFVVWVIAQQSQDKSKLVLTEYLLLLSGGISGKWDVPLQRHRQSQIQGKEVRLRESPQGGTTIPQSGPPTQGNRER